MICIIPCSECMNIIFLKNKVVDTENLTENYVILSVNFHCINSILIIKMLQILLFVIWTSCLISLPPDFK